MHASTKQPRWQPPQSLHFGPSLGAIRKGKSITSESFPFSLLHASSFGTAATFRRNALLTRFILGAPPSISARHSPTLSCFGDAPREADGDEINTGLSRCSYMLPKLAADAPDVMATRCDTYGGKVAPGGNGGADGNLLPFLIYIFDIPRAKRRSFTESDFLAFVRPSHKNSSHYRNRSQNKQPPITPTYLDSAQHLPQCPPLPNPSTSPNWPFTCLFYPLRFSSSSAMVSIANQAGSTSPYSALSGSLALL